MNMVMRLELVPRPGMGDYIVRDQREVCCAGDIADTLENLLAGIEEREDFRVPTGAVCLYGQFVVYCLDDEISPEVGLEAFVRDSDIVFSLGHAYACSFEFGNEMARWVINNCDELRLVKVVTAPRKGEGNGHS